MREALQTSPILDIVDANHIVKEIGRRVGERIGLGDQGS